MKRPSLQFYPADWRHNAKLRRCSEAARGAWMDVLCVLHDSDEYGVCRWPLLDLARAAGVNIRSLRELVEKGVLKGADSGAEPCLYAPRHAGQNGPTVVLVEPMLNGVDGPCWYSSRLVRDEWVRQRRGGSSRFQKQVKKKPNYKRSQLAMSELPLGACGDHGRDATSPIQPMGERMGDGSTSTSSSTTTLMIHSPDGEVNHAPQPTEPMAAPPPGKAQARGKAPASADGTPSQKLRLNPVKSPTENVSDQSSITAETEVLNDGLRDELRRHLQQQYPHANVPAEWQKCRTWNSARGQDITLKRLISWLNRVPQRTSEKVDAEHTAPGKKMPVQPAQILHPVTTAGAAGYSGGLIFGWGSRYRQSDLNTVLRGISHGASTEKASREGGGRFSVDCMAWSGR